MVEFSVPGMPVATGRARVGMIAGNVRMFTPAKTVAYEGLIAFAAQQAMDGSPLMEGALSVHVTAVFPYPASWSKKRVASTFWHTGRPDGDNLLKAVGDGLNGVVWKDDSQVAKISVQKIYGLTPMLNVEVVQL